MEGDATHAEGRDHGEPDGHHGPEQPRDGAGAEALPDEQGDDDRDRDRHDQVTDRRSGGLDTLDGRENRDRRRDHAVAEEERRAEDPEGRQCELRSAATVDTAPPDERDQRHDPAVAVVVGTHHEQDIGDRDDDRHRPEDQ